MSTPGEQSERRTFLSRQAFGTKRSWGLHEDLGRIVSKRRSARAQRKGKISSGKGEPTWKLRILLSNPTWPETRKLAIPGDK